MRWAVFKDYRGVAQCEPVDEGLNVWVRDIPAKPAKKSFWGKELSPAREATRLQQVVFDDTIYDRSQYCANAFEPAPEGFVFRDDIRYMVENFWGPVEVIAFIEDQNQGSRLKKALAAIRPNGYYALPRKEVTPHPKTDEILEKIRQVSKTG